MQERVGMGRMWHMKVGLKGIGAAWALSELLGRKGKVPRRRAGKGKT